MKKIILIIYMLIAFLAYTRVNAETLTLEETGLYYTRYNSVTDSKLSDAYYFYKIDGVISYCIEPGIPEGSDDYILSDWSNTNLSKEIQDKINLIAYYGYTYPGHNTKEYRTATQALIWETILPAGSWYHFNSYYWEWGEDFDISNERNEILSLIDKHEEKPILSIPSGPLYVGDDIVLEDTNKVLGKFNVVIDGISTDDYEIISNKIYIYPKRKGKITIKMTKKQIYTSNYKIFTSTDHQDMYTAGNIGDVTYTKEIDIMPLAALNLQKHSNKDNLQSLEGAVYNLYTENDEYIQKLITDEHGNAKTDAILKKGTYYLKEITAPKGYELDQEKHYIAVNATDDTIDINLIDDVIESELTILKETYLEGSNPQVEEGVVFNIYDINNDLYAAITTDQNGFAKVSLVYGTYTIKQENTKEGYRKVDDFVVTIDEESNKEIFYSLIDEAITEYVKITKVDKNDNPIKNNSASFKIFDIDNNKDLCFSLEGENICEFKTDASGEILIPFKVPYGIYQLIETKAPTGYKKMDSMNFTIDGSGELLTLIVKNDPIEASLHIKKIDDKEHPLENVSFAIYTDQDELVSIELTNEIGEVDIVLPFGKYYFKEYTSPDGYQIDETKYYLNIDGNKETFNYVIVNVPKTGKDKSYALDIVSVITGIVLCIKRLKDCYS